VRRLTDALDEARHAAEKEHGPRPPALIKWRHHAAIGGAEIDRARLELVNTARFRLSSAVANAFPDGELPAVDEAGSPR
jgi:hypothetical protein